MKENLEKRTFSISRRNFLKKAVGLVAALSLSPSNFLLNNSAEAKTLENTLNYGYSDLDLKMMKRRNIPPGIWEMYNRLRDTEIIRECFFEYKNGDATLRTLDKLELVNSETKMREPGFWVVYGLINNLFGGNEMEGVYTRLKEKKRFDKKYPSVYNFAEGFNWFRTFWIPFENKSKIYGIENLEEGKIAELFFLKSMFTALKYDDRIPNYNKLSYFEKRVREKEIGEELAVEYQNSSMKEKERIIKNLIIPKINELDNYGDDYMRKLWFGWPMTLNSSNYANMTRYSEDDERTIYGDKNFDLFFFNTEKILTPKKGKYILPQVRGPPYYYDKIF